MATDLEKTQAHLSSSAPGHAGAEEPATALGTLLRFLGAACHSFDRLAADGASLREALALLPAWRAFAAGSGLALPLAELETALAHVADSPKAGRRAVLEFNRLFQAPELPVPLWESVWLSPEKLLFTGETTAVRRWYRRFGLDIGEVGYAAEDHLGLELVFCGWLYDAARPGAPDTADVPDDDAAGREADALPPPGRPGLDDFNAFLREHPGRWAPACLARLARATEDPFWRPLLATGRDLLSALADAGSSLSAETAGQGHAAS